MAVITPENVKRFLAMVVLICFFLPLCQCTVKTTAAQTGKVSTTTDVLVPAKAVNFQRLDDLVCVAVFAWPLCFLALRRFATTRMRKIAVNLSELGCGLASAGYFALIFRIWGQLKYGGAMLLFAFLAYAVTSAFALGKCLPRRVLQ